MSQFAAGWYPLHTTGIDNAVEVAAVLVGGLVFNNRSYCFKTPMETGTKEHTPDAGWIYLSAVAVQKNKWIDGIHSNDTGVDCFSVVIYFGLSSHPL